MTRSLLLALLLPLAARTEHATLAVDDLVLINGPAASRFEATLSGGLGDRATEALHNGVPITLRWDLELRDRRALAWNVLLWDADGRMRLGYRPLSRRYYLQLGPEARPRSFPRLEGLLAAVHDLRLEFPPLEPLLGASDDVAVRFRLRLDIVALPPALRLPGYLDREWRVDTGWQERAVRRGAGVERASPGAL